MIEMLVIVSLTFMDGSITRHKNEDDTFPIVRAETGDKAVSLCQKEGDKIVTEMKSIFKDHRPKPSTFFLVCSEKENKENE